MTRSVRSWPVALKAGAVALACGLVITGWLAADQGWERFIAYDAVHFRIVAGDLDASDVEGGDAAYRYGRLGLPLLAWAMALGQGGLLDAAQALVTPLAFAATVALSVAIAGRAARHPLLGLTVLVVPGLWLAFRAGWADTLLTALVLAAALATIEGRQRLCVVAIAAATLTKEVGAITALPSAYVAWRGGDRRAALGRLAALAPAALWWGSIRLRSGEWPFLADGPARARAISPPLADIVDAMTGGRGHLAAAQLALLVGVVAIAAVVRAPRSALAWHAGAWGVLALCLGDNVLAYPGDALRVLTPPMCLAVLSLLIDRRCAEGQAGDEIERARRATRRGRGEWRMMLTNAATPSRQPIFLPSS